MRAASRRLTPNSITTERRGRGLEPSALDASMVLLERVVIDVGVLCPCQGLLVMWDTSGVLVFSLLMVKVGVIEIKYLVGLCAGVIPVLL